MAQQQARDEAGNIWNIDEAGNPVSLASAAGVGGGSDYVAPNPVQAARQSVDLSGAQVGVQRTRQQMAMDAYRLAVAPQATAAELEAQQLANAKARRDLTAPVEAKQNITDRSTKLRQLARQINRTQALYNTSIGTTKGIAGLQDYLPTDANARFDVAGGALAEQGLAAFRTPGTGEVSNRDAVMFERANLPTASTRDAAVDEQLRGVRARVDEALKALGQPAVNWTASIDGASRDDQQVASGGGGNSNPQQPGGRPPGYDVASVGGGISGGGGGGSFASAAGVAMAQKMKAVYNRGGGVREINQLLQDNGFQPLTDPGAIAAIQKRGPISFAPPAADDTRGTVGRALGAAADSGFGSYAIGAADALTAGNLDSLAGGQAGLAIDYARQNNPGASLLGTVTGGALAAGGAELGLARAGLGAGAAALGGDALYGAAYGAGSADDGSRLLGAAAGGAGGLLGGIGGRAAARGAGSLLGGVQNAEAQGLRAAGVPLTAGQAAGGVLKGVEDRLSGLPVVGDIVNARHLEGFQGFNRAAFDESLADIGESTGGVIREQGIDLAQDATKRGYGRALDDVNVTPDPQFRPAYDAAVATGSAVPRVGPEFSAYERANMAPLVDQSSFNGATIQDFIQQTRGADFGSDAMGDLVGRSVAGAEDAMRGLVGRQAPDVLPALGRADSSYRKVQVLRDAVNRARNGTGAGETGVFTPAQLSTAAAANAKKFGNSQGTTRQPFFDLTRAGQAVLPNSVPDSGTAGRAVVAGGLGLAGLGGGAGYAAGDTGAGAGVGLGAAGLLALGGSRAGQRALTAALLDRPDVLVKAGRGIQNRARIGGLFGAPLLAGTVPLLAQ